MKTTMLALLVFALAGGGLAPGDVVAQAQKDCPPEVTQAQTALKNAQAAAKSKATAKGPQDIQAPRSQAGARTQDVNAPRTQDVNAPRTQDVNAPRTQDVNAPRTQDVYAPRTQDANAPRTQDVDAPRLKKAEGLVSQALAACKKGDMTGASAKAKQALTTLNK
jgi:hypothetical protein